MITLVAAGGQMASFAPEPALTDALLGCSRGKKGAVARRHASYNVGSQGRRTLADSSNSLPDAVHHFGTDGVRSATN